MDLPANMQPSISVAIAICLANCGFALPRAGYSNLQIPTHDSALSRISSSLLCESAPPWTTSPAYAIMPKGVLYSFFAKLCQILLSRVQQGWKRGNPNAIGQSDHHNRSTSHTTGLAMSRGPSFIAGGGVPCETFIDF